MQHPLEHRLERRASRVDGVAVLQTCEELDPLAATIAEIVAPRRHHRRHQDRHTDVGRTGRIEAGEARRRDADDVHRIVVDQNLSADDRRIGGEAADPIVVAQDDGRMPAIRPIVRFRRKHPSDCGSDPERLKEVARDELRADPFRAVVDCHRRRRLGSAEDEGEGFGVALEVLIHRVRRRARPDVAAEVGEGRPDHDEALGLAHRQQAEHELIEQREDRRRRANAERKRQQRDGRERRVHAQLPRAVAHVAPQRVEPANRLHFPPVLLQHRRIPELPAGRPFGVGRRHALADVAFGQQLQVQPQLVVELVIRAGPADEPDQLRDQTSQSCGHAISAFLWTSQRRVAPVLWNVHTSLQRQQKP